jgi:hypothetical protein
VKVRDKELNKQVDVYCKGCLTYTCYWPRPDPGTFTQGKGYSFRSNDWLCGEREAHGCPDTPKIKVD